MLVRSRVLWFFIVLTDPESFFQLQVGHLLLCGCDLVSVTDVPVGKSYVELGFVYLFYRICVSYFDGNSVFSTMYYTALWHCISRTLYCGWIWHCIRVAVCVVANGTVRYVIERYTVVVSCMWKKLSQRSAFLDSFFWIVTAWCRGLR